MRKKGDRRVICSHSREEKGDRRVICSHSRVLEEFQAFYRRNAEVWPEGKNSKVQFYFLGG